MKYPMTWSIPNFTVRDCWTRYTFSLYWFVQNLIYRIRNKFRQIDTKFFSRHQFTSCLLHSDAIQFWAQIRSESAGYFMPLARRRSMQFCFKVDTTYDAVLFIQISYRTAVNFYKFLIANVINIIFFIFVLIFIFL